MQFPIEPIKKKQGGLASLSQEVRRKLYLECDSKYFQLSLFHSSVISEGKCYPVKVKTLCTFHPLLNSQYHRNSFSFFCFFILFSFFFVPTFFGIKDNYFIILKIDILTITYKSSTCFKSIKTWSRKIEL